MQLLGRLEMKNDAKIAEFLNKEHTGRLATLDASGFPQVIPMNFVFLDGVIYMHSHTKGEKIDNVRRDTRAGFEVDHEFEFLPSYFEDEHDASLADTLYASVVIKGSAEIVSDAQEKCRALNALMSKYQPEGRYDPVTPASRVLDAVAVISVTPDSVRGKYKLGQHLRDADRKRLALQILERGSPTAATTLHAMGFEPDGDGLREIFRPTW